MGSRVDYAGVSFRLALLGCWRLSVNFFAEILVYIYNNVYFCNLTKTKTTMAVIRNTASALANGRIGNTTYYVANGQQIARQAQNNSNYGESASRSDAQQSRRVRWSNLVNGYKSMSFWMKKAFESKSKTQSDYNKFMQLNINSSTVALTKDMAVNGCCVWESWQVSQGSLSPITLIPLSLGLGAKSDVKLSGEIAANATIADVSRDVIASNPTFQNGDNIAVIFFDTTLDGRGYPYSTSRYYEFTLDTSNTAAFSSLEVASVIESDYTNEWYSLATIQSASGPGVATGYAWIHTRKVNGNLQVSSQSIYIQNTNYVDQFSSDEAVNEAIASYGVQEDVPLDPSFTKASLVRATTNGAEILGGIGRTYNVTGQQTLVITGRHMTSANVQLYAGDTLYTPLSTADGAWTYILGDNETYRLMVNGNFYLGLSVSGIEVPNLSLRKRMVQLPPNVWAISQGINAMNVQGNCINYPYKNSQDYPRVKLGIFDLEDQPLESDFEAVNATLGGYNYTESQNSMGIGAEVTDLTKPAYITYKGFIVAVFNY